MDFFSKIIKSAKPQPSPQQLEKLSKDKKMEYILEKIKSEHHSIMNEIEQQLEDKIDFEQNVCYETYSSDMDRFASCALNVKTQAEERLNIYKKKVAFISISTSQCLFSQNKPVTQCKDLSLALSRSIMQSQLNFIKNWNPII